MSNERLINTEKRVIAACIRTQGDFLRYYQYPKETESKDCRYQRRQDILMRLYNDGFDKDGISFINPPDKLPDVDDKIVTDLLPISHQYNNLPQSNFTTTTLSDSYDLL